MCIWCLCLFVMVGAAAYEIYRIEESEAILFTIPDGTVYIKNKLIGTVYAI